MKITIGILCLSICSSASVFSVKKSVNPNSLGNVAEVKAFFEANLDVLSSEYEKRFGSSWNPMQVKSVSRIIDMSNDVECGYLVSFNKGYIAYSYNLSVYGFDTSACLDNHDYYYLRDNCISYKNYDEYLNLKTTNVNDDGMDGAFFSVTDVTGLNNFVLTSCLCKIPYLMQHYSNVEYGDWLPLCMKQKGNTCSPSAFSNLIFMYKEKGLDDLTIGLDPYEVKDYFGKLAGTTDEGGTSSSNIHPAMKHYLEVADAYNNNTSNRWQALAGSKDGLPTFENYYKGGNGHSAIRIGTGQSDYWWFFKSYWRIVVSWGPNYEFDEITRSCIWTGKEKADGSFDKNACIYVIDAQYAVNSWTIQR